MKTSFAEESFDVKPFFDTVIILIGDNVDVYKDVEITLKANKITFVKYTFDFIVNLGNWDNENFGSVFINMEMCRKILVVDKFDGDDFFQIVKYNALHKDNVDIIGKPLLEYYLLHWIPIPRFPRPIYNNHLENVSFLFNGFKDKKIVSHYVNLIHYMSGQVKTSVSNRITHLISKCSYGYKYHKLVDLGKRIVSEKFVDAVWEHRDQLSIKLQSLETQYRLDTFYNVVLMFIGFNNEKTRELEKISIANGANTVNTDPALATHVIIKDSISTTTMVPSSYNQFVLTEQWFWESVKCRHSVDVVNYQYTDKNTSMDLLKVPDTSGYLNTSLNNSKIYSPQSYMRSNVKQNLAEIIKSTDYVSLHPLKTPRLSQSLLKCIDQDNILSKSHDSLDLAISVYAPSSISQKKTSSPFSLRRISSKFTPTRQPSKRYHILLELQNTEGNYVSILDNLLKAKNELEDRSNKDGKKVLDTFKISIADSRIIFSNLPHIYNLHVQMYSQITEAMLEFKDEACVADIILDHVDVMGKIYPTYVRFMDNARQVYKKLEKTNTCFHAHLMTLMNKPEFGRQTIIELLVRPVQRLPSLNLLLKTLYKNTESSFSDHKKLATLISKLEVVIGKINECNIQADKYKKMFEIMNQIENCPPVLLSACREFIYKCDFIEIGENVMGASHHGTLFLYSDLILLTKRKSKPNKSPTKPSLISRSSSNTKRYKFVKMIYLNELRGIIDVVETKVEDNVVAIICKKTACSTERMICFLLCTKTINPIEEKREFLEILAKTVTNAVSHVDYRQILKVIEAKNLNIDLSNVNHHVSQTKKFTRRVSRMFSFKGTPRMTKNFSKSFLTGVKKRHVTVSSANSQVLDGYDSVSNYSNTADKISINSSHFQEFSNGKCTNGAFASSANVSNFARPNPVNVVKNRHNVENNTSSVFRAINGDKISLEKLAIHDQSF